MRQSWSASVDDRSVVVLAASSPGAARAFSERAGHPEATIVDRFGLATGRGRLGAAGTDSAPSRAIIHSLDWSREEMPQIYYLALARSGVADAWLVDEASGKEPVPLNRGRVGAEAVRVVPQAARAGVRSAVEVARAVRSLKRAVRPSEPLRPRSVAVVWSGSLGAQAGGAVSHAAGILSGFRQLGLRVELVADLEPPPQITAVIDGLTVIPPAPAAHRITREVRRLAANGPLRRHLRSVVSGLNSPFLYARHQAMATAAADIASECGIPLVLEWNASEVWAVRNWTRMPSRMKRVVVPVIGVMERSVVRRATVVASVSAAAGVMAMDAGAEPEALLDVPNAVDPALVDEATAGIRPPKPGPAPEMCLGWVGSFGEWHGAPQLIEALAEAASRPRAVLIGEGVLLGECQRLAHELGVAERVSFPGRLPHPEALRRLASCDALVSPTIPLRDGAPFFGSPTKIFEYMALGRPIIASDLGQIGEVLTDGVTARLVPPGSVLELAAAFDEIAADPGAAAQLGHQARLEAEAEHTWAHRARSIVEALADG